MLVPELHKIEFLLDDLVDLAGRYVVLAKGEVLFEGTSKQLRAEWELVSRMLGV
jgi:branched-chain amino acid transport system ATP-binding protein